MNEQPKDFFTFKKGEFRTPSMEELLGSTPVKEVKNEYELIEEGLNLRKKMADLCRAMARRLDKHAEARELHALESQIRKLNEQFEELKRRDIPL